MLQAVTLEIDIADAIAAQVCEVQARTGTENHWRSPLLAVAAADDPLFARLRQVVRPTHALPRDLLPDARSVVAFFLPFAPQVGADNRHGRLASEGWALAYLQTNQLIAERCARVGDLLRERGHHVHATPATHNFDSEALVSDWSHRHVAFIAGLGTFGINNMLITERGCCGRLGNLVTSAALEPDTRPAIERCGYKRDGSCRVCLDRCVATALFPDRFDRRRCYEMCRENERVHRALGRADVCGKCVVKLPCSHGVPAGRTRADPGSPEPKNLLEA